MEQVHTSTASVVLSMRPMYLYYSLRMIVVIFVIIILLGVVVVVVL